MKLGKIVYTKNGLRTYIIIVCCVPPVESKYLINVISTEVGTQCCFKHYQQNNYTHQYLKVTIKTIYVNGIRHYRPVCLDVKLFLTQILH